MARFKADLHVHTADDPYDPVGYSAETMIDCAAEAGVEVLAIACHGAVAYGPRLAEYARRRGVLLIPAIEALVEGKHVLILNPDPEHARAKTFASLRRAGRREAAIIAPHPFFPVPVSLGAKLIEHVDLFDGIEYCFFHFAGVNFNRKAAAVAHRYGLPLLGTTDTHRLPYSPSTFSWVDAEPSIGGIIDAIRSGRVDVETRPRTFAEVSGTIVEIAKYVAGRPWSRQRRRTSSRD